MSSTSRAIRAPRGTDLSCKGWPQEAALRMLLNNLDPEVAERPDDLIVYGGSGKAARNWTCFDAIVSSLQSLGHDETLLVQSGKPVAVFKTHVGAPRVLIVNAMLVPAWATWENFRDLEHRGLTMYGQMTAGSWIYIGSQGIVQGTYETLAAAARRSFGGTLAGRLFVSAGLGGMGGAQPLAATMNGAAALVIEVDPSRIARRLATRYVDEATDDLGEALRKVADWQARGLGRSIALAANAADVLPELVDRGIVPDILTDQTSAHDLLNGYVPNRLSLAEAEALRSKDPEAYVERSLSAIAEHVSAMLELKRRGAVTFDYGNNIRAQAVKAGVHDAFQIPGFVPEYVRPLFCEGKGPFRWAALSGDPADIHATDRAALDMFADDACALPVGEPCVRAHRVPGFAGAHSVARLWRPRAIRSQAERDGQEWRAEGSHRHRPRSSGHRIGRVAQSRDRRHARRKRCHRGLADPERPAQCVGRRDLGLGAPWRRRRHRLFHSRGHGDRRGRHRRGRRAAGTRADLRPRHRRRPARRRGLPGGHRHRRCARDQDPASSRKVRLMTSVRSGFERRILAALDASPSRIPVLLGACGTGRTHLLQQLRERLGSTSSQYVDAERVATTPERFLRSLTTASPFAHTLPSEPANAREAFGQTLAFFDHARASGGGPATFLLDEFLELRTFESFPGLRQVLRDLMQALASSGNRFVMTTRYVSRALRTLRDASPRFEVIHVTPLTPGEVRDMLPEPLKRTVMGDEAEADYISRVVQALGDGRPGYVQSIARAMVSMSDGHGTANPVAALTALLAPGGDLKAECGYCYELRLHRARGYGALKAILEILAEQEPLTLTEISHRLRRTPGSTKDYLSWLEDVDLVTVRQKRYSFSDPMMRLWVRLHCRTTPPPPDEVAHEVHAYALARLPQPETAMALVAHGTSSAGGAEEERAKGNWGIIEID